MTIEKCINNCASIWLEMDEQPCEKLIDQKEGILKVISTNDIKRQESRKCLGIKAFENTTAECNFCNNVACNHKYNYNHYMQQGDQCSDCGRWILYSEEQQHNQTCHAKKKTVACKYCSWFASESEIKLHEKSCNAQKCRYGQCTFTKPTLKDHEDLCAVKQKRGHATSLKCKSCNNLVCNCKYDHYVKQRKRCYDCGRWILYSEEQQHKQTCHAKKKTVPCKYCSWLVSESEIKKHEKLCNTQKCRLCSCTFSKHSLKDHEYVCALKQNHGLAPFLLCLKCKRYFRQDTFSQHTCKHNVKLQSQTYSTPGQNATNTQVLVISPVTCDNNTEERCALEAGTGIESNSNHIRKNHFQDGVSHEVPTGTGHRLPNEMAPCLPAGVIEITPIVEDPLCDSI